MSERVINRNILQQTSRWWERINYGIIILPDVEIFAFDVLIRLVKNNATNSCGRWANDTIVLDQVNSALRPIVMLPVWGGPRVGTQTGEGSVEIVIDALVRVDVLASLRHSRIIEL